MIKDSKYFPTYCRAEIEHFLEIEKPNSEKG